MLDEVATEFGATLARYGGLFLTRGWDNAQASATRRQPLGKLRDDLCSVREDVKVAYFTTTFAISNCRRNCRLMDI